MLTGETGCRVYGNSLCYLHNIFKQNEKTQEFVSNERTRKQNPEKTANETEINSLPDKEVKELVVRMVKKQTHRYKEQASGCQGGGGWEMDGVGVWG